MKNIIAIAKKEWLSYFTNPTGYIFAGLLLIVTNWMFFSDLFVMGQADLQPYWSVMFFLLAIFIPAITMGLIADEKKNGTWEVLLSLPINEIELAVGKFLGCAFYLLFVIALSIPVTITIFFLGNPDIGTVIGGYLGIILLSLSYISLGLFMSSLSAQAIVGFLGSAVFLIINNMMGQDILLSRVPTFLGDIISNLSASFRASKFSTGLIEISDLIFFISWIFIFITLTVLSLKSRNK